MTRSLTILALALATSLAMLADANAQQQHLLINNPGPAVQPAPVFLPKFGFQSYNLSGIGERVTYVQCHGLAEGMGLEPGDVILSLNGMPLTYHGAWNQALQNAMYQGGMVQLVIRDVNTGAVVYRNTFVGGTPGVGPITPKSVPYGTPGPVVIHNQQQYPAPIGTPGPITQKSVGGKNNNLSTGKQLKVNSQSIQQIGKMLKIGG
jgi:hypothetical protein